VNIFMNIRINEAYHFVNKHKELQSIYEASGKLINIINNMNN
jgi:hypothetical protein